MTASPAELQAIREPVKRYDMKPGHWIGGPCVSYIESPDGEWVLAKDFEAQSDEVRRLRDIVEGEAVRIAYVINNPSAWEDGFSQSMSDRLDYSVKTLRAALGSQP